MLFLKKLDQNRRKNGYIYSVFELKKHLKEQKSEFSTQFDLIKTVLALKNTNKITYDSKK